MLEISEARFEELVKDSAILDLIKNYIHSNKYVSKETLLIILGESEEEESDYLEQKIATLEAQNEILRVENRDLRGKENGI